MEPPLENASDEDATVEGIETEHSSSAENTQVYNRKHKYYRNSSSAEESNDTESDPRAAKCAKKATPLMHCP